MQDHQPDPDSLNLHLLSDEELAAGIRNLWMLIDLYQNEKLRRQGAQGIDQPEPPTD